MTLNSVGTCGEVRGEGDIVDSFGEPIAWESCGWWHSDLECVGEGNGLVTLRSNDGKQIVEKREGYKSHGKLAFRVGDRVRARFRDRKGVVYKVWWQDVRDRFVYMLDYGDRKSTRWYFADELELIEPRAADCGEQKR